MLNKIIIFTILTLASYSCTKKNNQKVWDSNVISKIHLNNTLANCIDIKFKDLKLLKNIVNLNSEIKILKSIGYCGCKSAQISYSVFEEIAIDEIKNPFLRTYGIISLPIISNKKPINVNFIISNDSRNLYQGKINLDINCKNPE